MSHRNPDHHASLDRRLGLRPHQDNYGYRHSDWWFDESSAKRHLAAGQPEAAAGRVQATIQGIRHADVYNHGGDADAAISLLQELQADLRGGQLPADKEGAAELGRRYAYARRVADGGAAAVHSAVHRLDTDGNRRLDTSELSPRAAAALGLSDGADISARSLDLIIREARQVVEPGLIRELDRTTTQLESTELAEHENTSKWMKIGGGILAGAGIVLALLLGSFLIGLPIALGGGGLLAWGMMRKPDEAAKTNFDEVHLPRKAALDNVLEAYAQYRADQRRRMQNSRTTAHGPRA